MRRTKQNKLKQNLFFDEGIGVEFFQYNERKKIPSQTFIETIQVNKILKNQCSSLELKFKRLEKCKYSVKEFHRFCSLYCFIRALL